MSGMKDQLHDLFSYPLAPGWRDPTTSREAARKMTSSAATLRNQVLSLLAENPAGLSVHQGAALLNRSVPAVQPRFSELKKQGLIKRAEHRHTNESGMSAAVWVLTQRVT